MKKILLITSVFVIIVMSFTACGSSTSKQATTSPATASVDPIIGMWKFSKIEYSEDGKQIETMALTEQDGELYLKFDEDGTVSETSKTNGKTDVASGTWKNTAPDTYVETREYNGDKVERIFTISGDTLRYHTGSVYVINNTAEEDNSYMDYVFVRE